LEGIFYSTGAVPKSVDYKKIYYAALFATDSLRKIELFFDEDMIIGDLWT